MTLLTADDVRHRQFDEVRIGRRGYAEEEVDDFLDEVVTALETRDELISDLQGRVRSTATPPPAPSRPDPQVDEDAGIEGASRLLALARRTADEYVASARAEAADMAAQAQREASELVAAAQLEAHRIVADADDERRSIVESSRDQRRQFDDTTATLLASGERARAHLEEYLSRLRTQVVGHAVPQPPDDALSAPVNRFAVERSVA